MNSEEEDPVVVIDENLIGVWFVQLPGCNDWMGSARILDSGEIQLLYRFRYADQADPEEAPSENLEEKHWFLGVITDTPEATIARMRTCAIGLAALACHGEFDEVLMEEGKTMAEFLEEFEQRSWVHLEKESYEKTRRH